MSSAKHGSHYLWWTQRLRECGAGSMARDVLAVLEVHAGKANGDHPGVAWPSIATIQSLLGVRKNAVLTGLRELKAAGIIRTTPAIAATARRIFTSSPSRLRFRYPNQIPKRVAIRYLEWIPKPTH